MRLPLLATTAALASALLASSSPVPAPAPAPASVSIEDGLRALTGSDFTSRTSRGMWFVEFYSPWCPHCQQFLPTWRDLSEISAHLEDSSAFYMARVDCTMQGDLCGQEQIRTYPSIHLYEDGKLVSKYTGSRKFPLLKAWIFGRAEDYRRRKASGDDAGSS